MPTAVCTRSQKHKTLSLLSTTFMNKKAVFHKSCISLINKQKLERKRKSAESIFLEKVESEQIDDIDRGIVPERATWWSQKLKKFVQNCFFCDKPDIYKSLYLCQSLKINQNLRTIRKNLGLFQLSAKISEGDMWGFCTMKIMCTIMTSIL